MKKKYSRRYICEAIAYWKNQLKKLDESYDYYVNEGAAAASAWAEGGKFYRAAKQLRNAVKNYLANNDGLAFYKTAKTVVGIMASMLEIGKNPFDIVPEQRTYDRNWIQGIGREADHLIWTIEGNLTSRGTVDDIFNDLIDVINSYE